MKKKILIGAVALIAVIIIYNALTKTQPPQADVWSGNKVVAMYKDDDVDCEVKAPASSRIYLEVSGSMTGYYVGDETKMTNVVTDIKNLDSNNTKLFFWGEKEAKDGSVLVHDVIKSAAKSKTGENTSTFHDKFAKMIDTVNSTCELTYLVTDGIMSLGKPGKNMESYMKELKGKISNVFKGKDSIAVAIYRHTGDFDGKYTNCMEQSKPHKGERPFYVIAIGKKANIRWLQQQNLNAEKSLFIGTVDVEGLTTKSQLIASEERYLENTNKTPILQLQYPEFYKSEFKNAKIKLFAGKKEFKEHEEFNHKPTTTIDNKLAIEVTFKKVSMTTLIQNEDCNSDSNQLTMIGVVDLKNSDNWWSTNNNDDDSKDAQPDDTTTYGLKTLIDGIIEGLQPDSLIFKAKFKYKK